MSVKILIATLEKDASLKEEAIRAEATEEARRIIEEANSTAKRVEQEERKSKSQAEEKLRLIDESQKSLDRRRELSANERLFDDRLREKVEKLYLSFMKKKTYREVVRAELGKIEKELGGIESISADPVTAKVFRKLEKSARVMEDESMGPGYIATSGGGRVIVDATLRARIGKVWPEAASCFSSEILELLEK